MKTHVQDTSLHSFFGEVRPQLGERQQIVYDTLRIRENFTIAELAAYLGWQEKSLTGRLDELEKKGLIEVIGGRNDAPVKRTCKTTGRLAMQWRIKGEQGRLPF